MEDVEEVLEEAVDNIDGWSRPSAFVVVDDPIAIALSLLNSRRVNSSL